MANYDGLTRNTWPGTWSPSADHPIVLDTEVRGGLRYISGNSGDQLTDIPGQRLQEGMLVYVDSSYDNYIGGRYYRYSLLSGEDRNASTGAMPNADSNWSEFTVATLDLASVQEVVDSDYVVARSSNYIQEQIDALIDAAPEALDTLNELAAAINDDSNFAGTITASLATKLAISDFVTYFDSNFSLKSTTDLDEGNNLYYTSARADSDARHALTGSGDISYDPETGIISIDVEQVYTKANFDSDLGTASTTDLPEGNNLYYTRDRFDSAITSIDRAILPTSAFQFDIGSGTLPFKNIWADDLYLSPNSLFLGFTKLSVDSNGALNISTVDSNYQTVEGSEQGILDPKNLDNAINKNLDSIGQQVIDTFSKSTHRTARYVIQMSHDSTGKYHSTEILLMHDDTDVYMTEYAVLKTQDSDVGNITASITDSNVKLLITPSFTNTSIKAKRLIIDV